MKATFWLIALLWMVCFSSSLTAASESDADAAHFLSHYDPPSGASDSALIKMIVKENDGIGPLDAKMFLRASRKDKKALGCLFQQFYKFTGGASPNECRANVLQDLLFHWGDADFAAVLSRQTEEIRGNMLPHLIPAPWLNSQVKVFKRLFPLTYKAGLETVDMNPGYLKK